MSSASQASHHGNAWRSTSASGAWLLTTRE
ncbi:Uncharacterised protein [Bordetella pertussis]|nr:Uncharacterised protein [Bordetella pertussis]